MKDPGGFSPAHIQYILLLPDGHPISPCKSLSPFSWYYTTLEVIDEGWPLLDSLKKDIDFAVAHICKTKPQAQNNKQSFSEKTV